MVLHSFRRWLVFVAFFFFLVEIKASAGGNPIEDFSDRYTNNNKSLYYSLSNYTYQSSSLKNFLYDLSDNKIASRFFCFYRYGGKILTSLVWSVVNSYCGFEKLVMNDWYCFKYAMFLGCRLQPRFMAAWGWIDMNINFLDGIAGFLIRFFLFARSYTIYENIFDFFNVCIDIKVYNNLYFAVNIVGVVRSFVLLYISYEEEKRKLREHIGYSF